MTHHHTISSLLPSWSFKNQRIFLRADLNVPLRDGHIINDHRLAAVLPTINYLLKHNAKIILATHIGRPKSFTANLSTSLLIPWFKERGYTIDYQDSLMNAFDSSLKNDHSIVLLENLRFFPGEKNPDPHFVEELARLADYYVNDAFATLHRTDSSITQLPQFFPKNKRTIGFLVEKELTILNELFNKNHKDFILILGGGKVADKIPVIKSLIPHVNTILLGPAIVFTFLKVMGKSVGKSLVDETQSEEVHHIVSMAQKNNVTLQFPVDYYYATDSFHGPLHYTDAAIIPENGVGISVGPKTVEQWKPFIQRANTIFYNGLMGDSGRPETLIGFEELVKTMAHSSAQTIVGGGDSVAAIQQLGYGDQMHALLTGGGATLHYLAGLPLPGLQALQD